MSKWIAEFELEDGDTMPEHMDLEYKGAKIDFHCRPMWIPCSERLPEEYGEYLVAKHTIGWNCEEYDVNDIAYFDGDGFHKADRVIAWMPLPEPYQEGGEKK